MVSESDLRPGLATCYGDYGVFDVDWKNLGRQYSREKREEARLKRKLKRLKKAAVNRKKFRKKRLRVALTVKGYDVIKMRTPIWRLGANAYFPYAISKDDFLKGLKERSKHGMGA